MGGTVRFAPKVDGFTWVVLVVTFVSLAAPVVLGLVLRDLGMVVICVATDLGALVLLRAVAFPLYYEITPDVLLVRHGALRKRVPLHEISRVAPTRDLMSAPALSLDRIQVDCNLEPHGYILVAPADRDGFLDLLAERTGLVRTRNRLTRVASAAERDAR